MQNYNFNGNGSILLKTISSGTYGSKICVAGEPLLYLTEVSLTLLFSNADKVSKQGISNLTASTETAPSILRVGNIKSSDSTLSILYKKQNNKTKTRTLVKSIESSSSQLYLPINSEEVLAGNLFIYDNNKVRHTSFTVSPDGLVSGLVDGIYTVFYSVNEVAKANYSLSKPDMAYLSAEIVVDGNIDGESGKMVINLDRVKLLSAPTMDFTSSTPFVQVLEFAILEGKEPVEVNYYDS